jgi:hypothetical protein
LPATPGDGLLYHYTDAGGLLGIVEHRVLWASDVWFMNDTRETRYGLEVMQRTLNAIEPTSGLESEVRETLLDVLATLEERIDLRSYIACLSFNGDQLSQWRAYGRSRGFSIGFDHAKLRQVPHDSSGLDVTCREVVYDTEKQDEMLRVNFRAAVAEAERRSSGLGGTVGDFVSMFLANALTLAPAFKDPAFVEEKEVRLQLFVESSAKILKFRAGAMGLTPYVDVHLAEEGATTISAMQEIIVGPQSNQTEAMRATRQLLGQYGYEDVEVRLSEVPLRA